MKIRLSKELITLIPGITVVAVVIKNIKNERKSSSVVQLLRGACAAKKSQQNNDNKRKEQQNILNKGHVDEELLAEVQLLESKIKKCANGKEVDTANNFEGLINYFSLNHLIPAFGYDLDDVEKDIELALIKPKQGKHPDDFSFKPESKNTVVWFIDIGAQEKEEFLKVIAESLKTVNKYCAGNNENIFVLNVDNPEADLGYVSEKERAYIESQKAIALESATGQDEIIEEDDDLPSFLRGSDSVVVEKTVIQNLQNAFLQAVRYYFTTNNLNLEFLPQVIEVTMPPDSNHGDYSVSVCMKIAKQLGKNPQDVAKAIIDCLKLEPELVDKIEVAGPGFINVHLNKQYLINELDKIVNLKDNFGRSAVLMGQKAIIDYSSVNVAKPMGVHHLMSTIIGQTLVNILKYAGQDVLSINYLGDWGTQFGKLIYAYKTWGNRDVVIKDPLNELLKLYVQFHKEADVDPTLEDKGREEFKKLEELDETNMELYRWIREVSIEELKKIYKILGVHFDEYWGEFMFLEQAKAIVKEGQEKGIVVDGEEGAKIVKFENDKLPPYILLKSDGTTIYSTRDLASLKYRVSDLHARKLLYVTDVAQKLHFEQLFETAKMYGLLTPEIEATHIIFGRMQMPEGRMSTRKGEIILVDEMIKDGVSRAEKIVEEKSKELSETERKRLATLMTVSSIKYNIISQNKETNIIFDWDRMLSLDGNSAPYLEYAYARAQSILRKIDSEKEQANSNVILNKNQTDLFSMEANSESKEESTSAVYSLASEMALIRHMHKFPEIIETAALNYKPNIIASYLFEMAKLFSSFYNEAPVANAENTEIKEARIKLVKAFTTVLRNGMRVLGIAVFERM